MTLQHLWAGWRGDYVASVPAEHLIDRTAEGCVFCRVIDSAEPDDVRLVVWEGERSVAVLNLYPYASGHLMVMPRRHVADLEALDADERHEVFGVLTDAVAALKAAYDPDGVNVGANLGRTAGAGIPGHVHLHAVPRWAGDTNFMTAIADTRVLPETMAVSWARLRDAWPVH